MKKILLTTLVFAAALGVSAQNLSIQDQLQEASKQAILWKGVSLTGTILGSGMLVLGAWELQNQAAAGSDFVYPKKDNFVLGVGLIGSAGLVFLAAGAAGFWGDLQNSLALQDLQGLVERKANP